MTDEASGQASHEREAELRRQEAAFIVEQCIPIRMMSKDNSTLLMRAELVRSIKFALVAARADERRKLLPVKG